MTALHHTISFNHDGTLLAFGDFEYVSVWDVNTGIELVKLPIENDLETNLVFPMDTLTFSPDGTLLATLSNNGIMQLWGIRE